MHDDRLEVAIREAGEAFEPPWLDVRAVVKRGRRRWWLTRPAVAAATLALVAGTAVALSRVDVADRVRPAAPVIPFAQWEPVEPAPISGRGNAAAVWTGAELIVWGGQHTDPSAPPPADGASYDPATGSWRRLPEAPGPALGGETAVWTGTELLLWGGETHRGPADGPYRGKAFDPSTGRWRRLAPSPTWSLGEHTAVWTGREMLVWGGVPKDVSVGAAYDPANDDWAAIPEGPLATRHGHEAVWTGKEMIVWGGLLDGGANAADAAAYDPETRTWRTLPDAPLDPLLMPVSAWTGREMIVTGGLSQAGLPDAGAAYDPERNRWRTIAPIPVAEERDMTTPLTDSHTTPVWTGGHVVFFTADGVLAYSPDDDRWSKADAPRAAWRMGAAAAWTGTELIAWSGRGWDDESYPRDGWTGGE